MLWHVIQIRKDDETGEVGATATDYSAEGVADGPYELKHGPSLKLLKAMLVHASFWKTPAEVEAEAEAVEEKKKK